MGFVVQISASNIDFANNDVHCECSPPLYGSSPLGFPMLGTTSSLIPSTIENVWELGLSREFGGFAVIRPKGSSVTIEELSNALSQLAVKNMWPTADLVQYGECGSCLWFLGRKDRVIKRFGYQICLERLEHAIKMCTLPGVEINNCFDNKVNVIVAAVSGKIQSWSVLDGNINWSYDCSEKLNGHAIFSDPVLDFQTNNVILSTNKGFLFALNVFSGKLVWMLDCRFASFPSNLCSLNTPSLLQIDAFPNVNNCLLVETRADGMLFACSLPPSNTSKLSVQLESPSILSTYRLPSQCFSSPVLYSHNSNDVFVVTGCRDNHVYGLSL
ncbi:unnamed protein product [Heterobilharzia americana]|nr:unnamed protein product [Heterobilharzia americana]